MQKLWSLKWVITYITYFVQQQFLLTLQMLFCFFVFTYVAVYQGARKVVSV